jgi:hypothetical protein
VKRTWLLSFSPGALTVRDSFGNTVTDSTAPVTISIGTNPAAGILSGTTTKNAIAGVARFADLSIDMGGNGLHRGRFGARTRGRYQPGL